MPHDEMRIVEADGIRLLTDDPILIAVMRQLRRAAMERDALRKSSVGDLRTLRRDVQRALADRQITKSPS